MSFGEFVFYMGEAFSAVWYSQLYFVLLGCNWTIKLFVAFTRRSPQSRLIAIFANVRNRASSKIKLVRPSVELEDRVILWNNIYNLIEQKGIEFDWLQ